MAKMTAEQLMGGGTSSSGGGSFVSQPGYQPYQPENDPVSLAIRQSQEELDKPKKNKSLGILMSLGKGIIDFGAKAMDVETNVAKGVLKGAGATAAGALSLGEKAAGAITGQKNALGKVVGGEDKTLGEQFREELLTPKGAAEKVGYGGEQIGELFWGSSAKKLGESLLKKFGSGWEKVGRIIGAGTDYSLKRSAQKASYEDIPDDLMMGAAGEAISVLGEGALKKVAEKLYQSALKPSTAIQPGKVQELVQTGLNEKILLTQHAKDVVAGKIDALDDAIGNAIQFAEDSGKTVSASEIKPFIESSKKFFGTQFDVKAGEKAISELDDFYTNFVTKYGDELPPTVAQQLKRDTMALLRQSYGQLSTVSFEGQKAGAAGLRTGIEKATEGVAGEINKKMAKFIELDEVLDKAVTRFGNSNLFSLTGSVIGTAAAGGGFPGVVAAGLSSLGTSAPFKSAAAIVLNELGKMSSKTGVPLQALLGRLADEFKQ